MLSKFKVGDRVRCIEPYEPRGLVERGIYVIAESNRYDTLRVEGVKGWYAEDRFELVEPLKLEAGCFVTIGDGHDEWEVDSLATRPGDLIRLLRPSASCWVSTDHYLTVTRAKPKSAAPNDLLIFEGRKYRLVLDE